MSKNLPKKLTAKEAAAIKRSAETISISELSRVTGVRIELLRRFINRQVGNIRAETWDRIYPHIRPYLVDPPEDQEKTMRIGPTYRRHPELVAMFSDQKVLIDIMDILPPDKLTQALEIMAESDNDAAPSDYECLSPMENKIMGAYLALPEDMRDQRLRKLIAIGIEEIRKNRRELAG